MQALFRIPLTKFCAVTAALVCAGGGVFVGGPGSASGATPTPPVPLDHFLCAGAGHTHCEPVKVGLPDGTSFGVGDPLRRLDCESVPRQRHAPPATPTTVTVTNEFSPTGANGPTPVPILLGRLRSTCTMKSMQPVSSIRVRPAAISLTTYACSSAHYPTTTSAHFEPPFPVTVDGRVSLRVFGPSRLCVATVPQPAGVAALAAPTASDYLLCFRARVAYRFRDRIFYGPLLRLCVPSAGGDSPAPSSSTSTSTSSTTSTSTSTTRPPITQPCAGRIVNGVCVING